MDREKAADRAQPRHDWGRRKYVETRRVNSARPSGSPARSADRHSNPRTVATQIGRARIELKNQRDSRGRYVVRRATTATIGAAAKSSLLVCWVRHSTH